MTTPLNNREKLRLARALCPKSFLPAIDDIVVQHTDVIFYTTAYAPISIQTLKHMEENFQSNEIYIDIGTHYKPFEDDAQCRLEISITHLNWIKLWNLARLQGKFNENN